jgi:ABC-type Fe3+/spermidine/putrescine transport system ATPase subunit
MSALLELDKIVLVLGGRTALDEVDLSVNAGEVLAIAGPSGSGKSSLLRIVLGLVAPSQGIVRLRGGDASRDGRIVIPPEERRLAVVFQDLALFPHLSVRENLAFGLEARGVDAKVREARIRAVLADLDLSGKDRRMPASLSGGERQRVAIARALVLEPDLVLFDEPLASLDVALRAELLELVLETLASRNAAALWVTHDAREAERLARRIVVLEGGRVTQCGTAAELTADPRTPFVRAFAAS